MFLCALSKDIESLLTRKQRKSRKQNETWAGRMSTHEKQARIEERKYRTKPFEEKQASLNQRCHVHRTALVKLRW